MTFDNPAFSGRPVIICHLADPPGSGLAACSGEPYLPPIEKSDYSKTPLVLCPGCHLVSMRGQ